MKHTMRILTLLMLAVVVGTGQTWGRGGLGYIVFDDSEVTNKGEVTFYTDANCEQAIDFSGGRIGNLTSSDLTAVMDGENNIIGYTVYIKAVPNYDYTLGKADNTTHAVTFITAEKTTNVFQAPRRTQSDPTLNLGPDITLTATSERFVYSFVMPASGANVTIHVDFPKRAKQSVRYIDVDGELKDSPEAYFIDGSETALGVPSQTTSWYVVPAGSVSYACSLPCTGNVNLILADGATMAIGSTTTSVTGRGISNDEGNINIYGQSQKTGKLTVYAETYGVYASSGNIIINGCEVTAEGYNGIYAADGKLTINGGTVNATGEYTGLYAIDDITLTDAVVIAQGDYSGISSESDIIINGGDVTATSTDEADGHALFVPSGGGKIVITATDTEIENNNHITVSGYEGIYTGTGNISINGFTVQATGLANAIYASSGDIILTNATVTAKGEKGIDAANGGLTINGGDVTATATGSEDSDGYGLYAKTNLTVGVDENNTAAKVTATGKGSYSAIYAYSGDITLIDADITAMAENAYAIYAEEGAMNIAGGTVNATANTDETAGSGIYASKAIDISEGCELTAMGINYGINSATGVTIDGCTVTASGTTAEGIYANGGIVIANTDKKAGIKVTASGTSGILANGDVNITDCEVDATGTTAAGITANEDNTSISLTGAKVSASGVTSGIHATYGGLTITGGDVTATGTDTNGYGLYAETDLTVGVDENNTTVKVTATGKGSNSAIYAYSGDITLIDADITAMAENAYAIYAEEGAMNIAGGTVNATANTDETAGSGIYASKAIDISEGCELTAMGINYGINSATGVTIDGCTVTASGTTAEGIYANGGIVIANTDKKAGIKVTASGTSGILANGDVNITDCEVDATGTTAAGITANEDNTSISLTGAKVSASGVTSGIYATDGDLTINGGDVTATATATNGNGLYAGGNINIEWTNETTDFITASSYDGTIVVADGQHFRATKNENDTETTVAIIDGTVNDVDVLESLAGSTLKPLEGIVVSTADAKVTLSGDPTHYAGENGVHYYIYEASAANTEILLGYGDIDAGKSVTYALTKTGTDEKVGLIASYMNGKRELVNRQGKDASFTLPVPAHDVTIATNINPFLQPGGYCGDVLIDTSVTPIEITDYSKNVWWIVSDIDNVRTVTIVRGEGEHNDIINDGVGCPWSDYVATVAVIPSGMTDIGKLGLTGTGVSSNENDGVILILVDDMAVYQDYIQNGGDIDDSQKNKFAPKTFNITVPKGWGTYCQSYPVGYSLSTGATPYTISGIENNAVSVAVAASVAPYTPVLINNTNETEVVTLTAVPSTAGGGAGSGFLGKQEGTGYNFYGNPYDVVLTNDDIKSCENDFDDESVDYIYAIGASDAYQSYGLYNGDFYAVDDASAGIAGHKCWLNVAKPTTSAPRLSIVIGGETTSLASMEDVRCKMEDVWYTLDGRKLDKQPTVKGLYIHNGRKVVIK